SPLLHYATLFRSSSAACLPERWQPCLPLGFSRFCPGPGVVIYCNLAADGEEYLLLAAPTRARLRRFRFRLRLNLGIKPRQPLSPSTVEQRHPALRPRRRLVGEIDLVAVDPWMLEPHQIASPRRLTCTVNWYLGSRVSGSGYDCGPDTSTTRRTHAPETSLPGIAHTSARARRAKSDASVSFAS